MDSRFELDTFLPYRLSVASNAVSSQIGRAYRKRFGLKIAEWRLIAVLASTPQMTSVDLTEATRMDKITISRAAAALIARDLVKAATNPDDGRSHLLSLTPAGQRLFAEIAPIAVATEARLVAAFDAEELATLHRLLRRVEAAAMAIG